MIIIFSRDEKAIRDLARTQANAAAGTFGHVGEAFKPLKPIGPKEAIFIVADDAKRLTNYQPAVGDKDIDHYWTAEQMMHQLDTMLPQNFAANVYIAARQTANPRSDVDFAKMFRNQLIGARKSAGKVYGLVSGVVGPIPAPSDSRWVEAKA